ncbi:MAG: hypothetical protein LIP12_17425 [Clostridiales bacterium]|nr:hypothetical protein [Clostridiales bacterium]
MDDLFPQRALQPDHQQGNDRRIGYDHSGQRVHRFQEKMEDQHYGDDGCHMFHYRCEFF